MAFKAVKYDQYHGQASDNSHLMTDSEAVAIGEALSLSSGRLTKCAATTAPEYISNTVQDAETSSAAMIATEHVNEGTLYETTSTGQIAASAVGGKYTLHTDGLQITTTTTNGVFEVVWTDGATTSKVRGYFRR